MKNLKKITATIKKALEDSGVTGRLRVGGLTGATSNLRLGDSDTGLRIIVRVGEITNPAPLPDNRLRNRAIMMRYDSGETSKSIGADLNLTVARVVSIYHREKRKEKPIKLLYEGKKIRIVPVRIEYSPPGHRGQWTLFAYVHWKTMWDEKKSALSSFDLAGFGVSPRAQEMRQSEEYERRKELDHKRYVREEARKQRIRDAQALSEGRDS